MTQARNLTMQLLALFSLTWHVQVFAGSSPEECAAGTQQSCGGEQDDGVALLSQRVRVNKHSADGPSGDMSCSTEESNSMVIQEILKSGTLDLTGPATGNPTDTATVQEPFGGTQRIGKPSYKMYGSNQHAIVPPMKHCADRYNNFTEEDFNDAWKYLSCELNRLLNNPAVAAAFDRAVQGIAPVVMGATNPPAAYPNPWIGATANDLVDFFEAYFWMLPQPTGKDTGLSYILKINFLLRENTAGIAFFNTFKSKTAPATTASTEVFDWTYKWVTARGMWMDSIGSTKVVADWVEYLNCADQADNVHASMKSYNGFVSGNAAAPGYGYKSFNQFFARTFKDQNESRPISQLNDKMVVTAPGDVEVNFIINKLTNETRLPVKGNDFNIKELLNSSELASKFIGGTAVSNVLMPYAYHNFHAPVDGRLVEAVDIPGFLYGIKDGNRWYGSENTGGGDGAFTIFGGFHRVVMIYDTGDYGLVAQIAVGLADISTICGSVQGVFPPVGSNITKGDRMGYFLYGGSLNILLFMPGVFNAVNVLMGQRIGSMSKPAVEAAGQDGKKPLCPSAA